MISDLAFPDSAGVRVPEALVLRRGRWSRIRLAVRYGCFRHRLFGTCLIDTGYSRRVTAGTRSLPLSLYAAILQPELTEHALPRAAPDVQRILLTHLHADHVSALHDYPAARIIADAGAVRHFAGAGAAYCTRHGVFRELWPTDMMDRLMPISDLPAISAPHGLGIARDVFGDGEVLALPLPGHMLGHTGYLFARRDPPLLYAGDADWLARAILDRRSPGPPAAWILHNRKSADETAERLRQFSAAGGQIVLCHDPAPLP